MRREIFTILAVILAFPALAADLPTRKEAPPPPVLDNAYNWTGFHIGVNGGVDFGQYAARTDPAYSTTGYFSITSPPAIAAAGAQNSNRSGFTGGITAGYDWQLTNFVFGLESDFDYLGGKSATSGTGVYPCCAPSAFTVKTSVATDWLATARARVGFLATPSLLLYGTGGLAAGNVRANYQFSDNYFLSGASESASLYQDRLGWTVGAGGEYALMRGWSIKAEYLYVDLGKSTVTSNNLTHPFFGAYPSSVFTHSVDVNASLLRLGLNYKF